MKANNIGSAADQSIDDGLQISEQFPFYQPKGPAFLAQKLTVSETPSVPIRNIEAAYRCEDAMGELLDEKRREAHRVMTMQAEQCAVIADRALEDLASDDGSTSEANTPDKQPVDPEQVLVDLMKRRKRGKKAQKHITL